MNNTRSLRSETCADLMILAERELGAVTELYGAEQAKMSAQVWLDELQVMNSLPGATIRDLESGRSRSPRAIRN